MTSYVALRGINVGGKNLIGMPALKARFEENGFEDGLDVHPEPLPYLDTLACPVPSTDVGASH